MYARRPCLLLSVYCRDPQTLCKKVLDLLQQAKSNAAENNAVVLKVQASPSSLEQSDRPLGEAAPSNIELTPVR